MCYNDLGKKGGVKMDIIEVFRDLAIIILAAKLFGLLARKLKAPAVVGEIIAGIILGFIRINGEKMINAEEGVIPVLAEIGVVLIMFSAGLGTNLKSLLKSGAVACLIALAGVFVPFLAGTAYYAIVYGEPFTDIKALIIGTILTATSVSITVEALRELGYLKGKVGTTILSAAIIDDIIGMIVLTVVMSLDKTSEAGEQAGGGEILKTVGLIVLFFVFAIVVGYICYIIFKKLDSKWKHTHRIPILGLALCFAMAYISNRVFGVADIIGAYTAGIILCNIQDSDYIANKVDTNSYMFFGPIFFVSIGLKTDLSQMNLKIFLFALGFVLIGLVTKIIGCGLVSKLAKFKWNESLKIGIGMMTRGEVALIVATRGVEIAPEMSEFFTAVILLIVVSSILTPILLKLLFDKFPEKNEDEISDSAQTEAQAIPDTQS